MKYDFFSNLSWPGNQALQIQKLKKEQVYLEEKCRQLEEALAQADYLPTPPQDLRVRVGGWEDVDHFLGVGRKIYWDLKRLLKGVGKEFESFNSVLDFGCGCGRVIRFLRPPSSQVITGLDIDPESIGWCQENLSHISRFETISPLPPIPYNDNSFDFVYAISVFTHLPEDMQFQWLEELRRITKPQGIFITSTHGEQLLSIYDTEALSTFNENGFFYMEGGGTKGLPDFYQTTFHAKSYIEQNWSKYFHILNVQTRAINNHQDVVVCQKV